MSDTTMRRQHANVIPMSDSSTSITPRDVSPTILPDAFLDSAAVLGIRSFHMPRYRDLPSVQLYREQVISYVEQVLSPLDAAVEGPWLTQSMVNNYVKSGLVGAPHKKLYGTDQIARLIVICIFKQVLSINAVSSLFRIQRMTYDIDVAYDYVATELEAALAASFSTDRTRLLVRNAVTAFAARALLITYLGFIGYEDGEPAR